MRKRNLSLVILIIFTCLLSIMVIFINRSVIVVRLYELSNVLNTINQSERGQDYMDILFKFEMNRRLYNGKINEGKLDVEELRIISIVDNKNEINPLGMQAKAVIPLVNSLRFLIGKKTISYLEKDNDKLSELAYFYERNGYLKKAISIYDDMLKKSTTSSSSVLLHKGYCLAVTGDIKGAEKILSDLIIAEKNKPIAIAAATLLMYIRDFASESERILKEDNPTLESSIKLLQLTSFENAFKMLSRLDDSNESEKNKIHYYKARYYEETGDKNKALELYQNLIAGDGDIETSKQANRRMVILSVSHPEREKISLLTQLNNTVLEDPLFDKMKLIEENIESNKKIEIEAEYELISNIDDMIVDAKKSAELMKKVDKKTTRNGTYSLSYYTKRGDIRKIENYNRRGVLTGYYVYVYDNSGNRIRIDAYDKDGILLEYY